MAGIALNGLSSGMDTGTMISQLVAVERQGRTRLEYRQAATQARTDHLATVSTKLNTLKFAAQDFKLASLWSPQQTVDVSDATKLAATRTGGAGTGATTIDVLGLASSSQRTFTYTPPAADETLTFNGVNVPLTAGLSLDDAVVAINGQPGTGVIAVNAGGKLVVSSTATGAASAFTWTGGALAQDSARAGTDAEFRLNGGAAQTSSTNVIATAIPGVEVTLKALTTSPVTVNVGSPKADVDKIAEKVKKFVEAYNGVVDTVRGMTTEKRVVSPTSASDAKKGVLFGDGGLTSMLSSMRLAISSAVDGLGRPDLDQLAEIGITTGAASTTVNQDALAGKLVFDETKFKERFAADGVGVRSLLGGVSGTPGIAQRFEDLITPLAQSGGVLSSRRTETDSELRRIRGTIDRFDDRLVVKEERLREQFQTMERLLARQRTNGNALTNALNGLL